MVGCDGNILETILSIEEDLADFVDMLAASSYVVFERCTDEFLTCPWRSNLLKLYLYIRKHLDRSEKLGRPLLLYYADMQTKRLRGTLLIRHMLFKGYDISAKFSKKGPHENICSLL
jgi:hypothetical protein